MADIKNRIEELQQRVAEAKEGVRATMTIHELGKESIRDIIGEVAETQAYLTALFDKEDGKLSASSKVLKEELDNLVKEGTDADSARLRQIQIRAKDIAAIASGQGGIEGDYITELADSLATGSTRAAKVKMGSVMPQSDMFGAGIFKTIFGANFTDWALGGDAPGSGEPSSKRNRANLKLKQAQAELDSVGGSSTTSTSASESAEIRREGEQRQGEIKHKENQVISLLEKILSAVTGRSFAGGGGAGGGAGGGGGGGGGGADGEMSAGDLSAMQELGAIVGSQVLLTKGGAMGAWIYRALGGGAGAGAGLAGASKFTKLTVAGKSIQGMGALGTMGAWTAKALGIVATSAATWTTAGIGAAIWGIGTMMIKKYEGEAQAMEAAHGYFMGFDTLAGGIVIDRATGVVLKAPHLDKPLYEGQRASDRYNRRLLVANAQLITDQIQNARILSDGGAPDSEVIKWLKDAQAAAGRRPSMVRKVKGPGGEPLSQKEAEELLKFGHNQNAQFIHDNGGTSSRFMAINRNLQSIYTRFGGKKGGFKDSKDRGVIRRTMTITNALQGVPSVSFGLDREGNMSGEINEAISYADTRRGMVKSSMMDIETQRQNQLKREAFYRGDERGEDIPLILPTDMTGERWDLLQEFKQRRFEQDLKDFNDSIGGGMSTGGFTPAKVNQIVDIEGGATRTDPFTAASEIIKELQANPNQFNINAPVTTVQNQSTVIAGDIADANSIYDKSRQGNFNTANHGGGQWQTFHP